MLPHEHQLRKKIKSKKFPDNSSDRKVQKKQTKIIQIEVATVCSGSSLDVELPRTFLALLHGFRDLFEELKRC